MFVTKFAPGHPMYNRHEGADPDQPQCTGEHDCQCGGDHGECECEDCSPEPVESVTLVFTRTITHTVTLDADDAMRVTHSDDLAELRQLLSGSRSWYPDWDTMYGLVVNGEYGRCDETDENIEFESIEEG